MAPPTAPQLAAAHRLEQVLRLVAPALDLVLAVGDRVSRVVDRSDDEPIRAIRPRGTGRTLPR
jgi:hypothetical protein